jgi:hypothetical protein
MIRPANLKHKGLKLHFNRASGRHPSDGRGTNACCLYDQRVVCIICFHIDIPERVVRTQHLLDPASDKAGGATHILYHAEKVVARGRP